MNVPVRVYGMYVLTVRKPMVFSYKLYYLLRLLNTHPITIIDLMHGRNLNNYSNRCDLNRRDSKLQNFAHNFSNFKIIFELSIFESSVVSRILTFTFFMCHGTACSCQKNPTSLCQRVWSYRYSLKGFYHSYSAQHQYSAQFHYHSPDW